MKGFTRILIRCFIALAVALTVITSLAVIHGSTSYAAPLRATHVQVKSQSTVPLKLVPGSSVTLSITKVSGRTATFSVNWGGGSWAGADIALLAGDGSRSDYTCWLNCASGSTTFTHTYPKSNTYYLPNAELIVGGYVWAVNSIWVVA